MTKSGHLVRGKVPQAGHGSPHQLSEGGVGTLPARVNCDEEGEDEEETLHDEVRSCHNVTDVMVVDNLEVDRTFGSHFLQTHFHTIQKVTEM